MQYCRARGPAIAWPGGLILRFITRPDLDSIDQLTARIGVLDARIADMRRPYERQIGQPGAIPGFGITTAQDLTGETGVDMSVFPAAGHLASCARQAPG